MNASSFSTVRQEFNWVKSFSSCQKPHQWFIPHTLRLTHYLSFQVILDILESEFYVRIPPQSRMLFDIWVIILFLYIYIYIYMVIWWCKFEPKDIILIVNHSLKNAKLCKFHCCCPGIILRGGLRLLTTLGQLHLVQLSHQTYKWPRKVSCSTKKLFHKFPNFHHTAYSIKLCRFLFSAPPWNNSP